MEKEKKKHRRPLAAERLVAAMFVFVPCGVAPRASEAPRVRIYGNPSMREIWL